MRKILIYLFIISVFITFLQINPIIVKAIEKEETDEVIDIKGGLTYQEEFTDFKQRSNTTVRITKYLDFGTGVYRPNLGIRAITVTAPNGSSHDVVLTELMLNEKERVYCIEPLIKTSSGSIYEIAPIDDYLTATEKINLGLVGFFGYGYDGDNSDSMMAATQVMIWKYQGYGISDIKQELQDKMDIIQHRMDTFRIRPSFETKDVVLDGYGDKNSVILNDKNKVLSNFHLYDNGGFNVEKNGNSLTISVDKSKNINDGTITLDRMNRNRLGNTIVWRNPDGKQTLANVKWSDPSSMKIKVHVAVGDLELIKKDDLNNAVKGAKFKVATKSDMSNVLGTYTTDSNGKILIEDIPTKYKALYYQEIFVPEPYTIDTTIRSIDLKDNKKVSTNIVNNHQKATITIHKEDIETGGKPQGDASLSGWTFGLYSDKDKKHKIQNLVGLGNTATSKLLDVNKTYFIYEEKVPEGYLLNKEPVEVKVNYGDSNVSVQKIKQVLKDEVIKGSISIHKFVDKELSNSKTRSAIKQPLANVHFEIKHDKTGNVVDEMITNSVGYAKSKLLPYGWYTVSEIPVEGYDTLPPFKVKIDKDGKVYSYYVENTAIVTQLKIIKKDSETNKVIPLAGTKFKILDSKGNPIKQHLTYPIPCVIDEFITGHDGTVTLPEPLTIGNYTLIEIESPYSYLLNDKPIPFIIASENKEPVIEVACKDSPAKGVVEINKTGEQFIGADFRQTEYGKVYTPIYEIKGLDNTEFDIIAVEDIVTPDGTIRAKKDTIVDTVITKNGKAVSKELYLGKYKVIEKKTDNCFLLDKKEYYFELKYKDQHTQLVKEHMDIKNVRKKASVLLNKKVETVKGQSYNPYDDIRFGLFAKEDIKVGNNEIIIEKDSLMEVIKLGNDGKGTFKTDLPASKYYVKELQQGNGYILNDTQYEFEYSYTNQEQEVIKIHINNDESINNELMRGNIKIKKFSEDKNIENIPFKVTGLSDIGTKYEKIFYTDINGEIFINNILKGKYEISELLSQTTVGYIIPESQNIIVEQGTTEVEFQNTLQRGSIIIEKSTEDNNDLSGFEFEITGTTLRGTKYCKVFKTNKDGRIVVNDLLVGNYIVKELSNNKTKKYILPKSQTLKIEYGKTSYIKVENKLIPSPPETNDTTNTTTTIVLLGGTLVILLFNYGLKKKHKGKRVN